MFGIYLLPVYFISLILCVLVIFYAERKLSAFIQDRLGPTHVGKWGMLQAFADLLKLVQKEDVLPSGINKVFFLVAPFFVFAMVFAGYCMVPLTCVAAPVNNSIGVFFVLAIIGLDVPGIIMAGWGSNNKYAIYGATRAVAQMLAYEVPVALSILCVVAYSGTLNLNAIIDQQIGHVNSMQGWYVWQHPFLWIAFVIYFISTLAECNRAPFDLPESESELVAGFHTEYGGFRWSLFFLAEYAMMFLVAAVGVILFFGGWGQIWLTSETHGWQAVPTFGMIVLGVVSMLLKTLLWCCVQVVIRWAFPRLRADQLMHFCWYRLTPAALVLLLVIVVW